MVDGIGDEVRVDSRSGPSFWIPRVHVGFIPGVAVLLYVILLATVDPSLWRAEKMIVLFEQEY